ncbi:Nuf2 family-domain-containing protein [Naematelia encephala]|uniref:Nuf2 family-domain-containing protein n=1 Tax=Naematelia encephala TaxID=71784 RepID=A0A1Y2AE46_9TREE|nr:Nuf2 family-domain-containing protein [Naematelia encephala]
MSQARTKQAPDYPGFPMMTTSEILDCLSALGINVMPEDMTKPSANSVQMIYTALLDALMGAPMELLDGPRAALMGMMEYKDIYADALQFTMFFNHVRRLVSLCGIQNFAMSDLTRPDAGRLRLQLSGLMNFAKFRDERTQFIDALKLKIQRQADKTAKLRRNLDKIEADIEEITAKNAEERPLTEEARKINEGVRNELLELRSQQVKLSHEVEELKKERQAVMDLAATKQHELTSLTQHSVQARSRLVQSPDRIKRHISEMSSSVAAEKSTLASFQRKARELGNRLEVYGGLEMDLKGLIDLEKGIDEQRGRVEETRRSMLALKAKLEGKEIESQGMAARLDQLDRQLQNASDKVQRQQELGQDMRQRAKDKVEHLKQQYMIKSKERGVWQKERDLLLAEQRELEAEMNAFTTAHEQEIDELLQEYWTMRKQAEDYMNTMTVKLGLKLVV